MARIPQDEIDRLKQEYSLERIVTEHGVELKAHGADLIGRCPFHDDKTPSLVVTPSNNLWHCLGACQTGGSVIDWVKRVHGASFRHAIEILRSDQMPAAPARVAKHGTIPKLPAPVDMSADDQALFKQVVGYYHTTLKESPEALAYLKARGITSTSVVEKYQLGFANRTLGLRLPDKNRKAGAEIRSRLQSLGVLRETGHEHFNGSLVIPLHDETGNVVGMYGRKITVGLRSGTPDHLYLPGPHRGVFNVQALERYPEIILCEALIDALTFLDAGFPNVTSAYGINGFTADHWAALKKYKTRRVLIAYDRDDAGEGASKGLSVELMAAGIECFRVQFPRGMDANEYALKVTPAAKSLGVAIRNAVWMGKGRAPERDGPAVAVTTAPPTEAVDWILGGPLAEEDPDAAAAGREILAVLDAEEAHRKPAAPTGAAVIPRAPQATASPRPTPAVAEAKAPPVVPPSSTPLPAPSVEPIPASPTPTAPVSTSPIEREGQDVWVVLGDRRYRVRGLEKAKARDQLKVNLYVTREGHFHVDSLDLYSSRQRALYTKEAALELGIECDAVKKDLGRVLMALEEMQAEEAKAAAPPKPGSTPMSAEHRDEAMELLRDPRLLDRILDDFLRCGVVGEEINKLLGYLAMVSRLLDTPLAVVIQSSTAAGKSSLMEAILAFLPKEHGVKYSAMTGQSLFYMGEADLKHKVLAVVEEEGAERATYALKLLQSEGELTIASTGKDPSTGRHVTHEYHVEGPVMIFLTTTAVDIDEELLNRCIVLTVNEDREQTRVIHQMQREGQTLEGQLARRDSGRIRTQHQNAQRLLRPLMVVNPYARRLTFRDDQTRTRRDHGKYLTLIRTVALLHQYQRPVKTGLDHGQVVEYIEVTVDDIRTANRLAHEVLGRTLDEVPPQPRKLLQRLNAWVSEECARLGMDRADYRFSRRDVRAATGLSEIQARTHMQKLVDLEYLLVHRGMRGQSFVYELVYDGQGASGEVFLMGLIDPDALEHGREYDGKFEGSKGEFEGGSIPHRGPIEPGSRTGVVAPLTALDAGFAVGSTKPLENAVLDEGDKILSYLQVVAGGNGASRSPGGPR